MQTAVVQPGKAELPMTLPPTAKRPFADPKQFRGLHLAQFGPLRAAKNIFKAHPAYPLVKARPIHANHRF